MRHFTVESVEWAKEILRHKARTIHFLRLTNRIAIIWDREDGK